jgi:16S rRNA processing protein RimM
MGAKRILLGEIGRPHGVRGLVKLWSFTADPADIGRYGPLSDEGGTRRIALEVLPGGLARVQGVADRDAAAKLTGTRLYVDREKLPAPEEEEFYLADLIGLVAVDPSGAVLGSVVAVEDFGGGPFLTLRPEEGRPENGREVLVAFTRATVPLVEVAAGRLTVVLPEEVVVEPTAEESAALAAEADEAPSATSRPLPRRAPFIGHAPGPRRKRGGSAGGPV